jgi:RNA polymerase sigma-70 factor (ECF subfamily)
MKAAVASAPATHSDAFLIARAGQGDVRAFEQLYRDYVGRVHGLCLRLTRDVATAEDCTQQTFINAWHALAKFEGRSSLATWLHRIAVNVALGHRRRSAAVPEVSAEDVDVDEVSMTFDTPVEVAEIEAAIGSLPDGARDVLVLSGIYGYAHSEVAAMLGVAEGTCKAQLHRARQLLRERLDLRSC